MTEPRDQFQEQVAALRRSQILDAATRVFAARGFHRSTIRDVARAAGVADGTIYNYFEGKTALLLGILNRLNETERREADFAQIAGADPRAAMRAYFHQRLTTLSQDGLATFQALLPEVLADPELRETYARQIIEPTFALAEPFFARMVEQGQLRPLDVPLMLRAVSGMFLGLLVLWIMGDQQVQSRLDALPDLLVTMLLDGMLPEGGPQ